MASYLSELIERYKNGEIDDASVCDNITRITKKEEFILDVNENRKKENLTKRKYAYLKYGKSPEDILIGWENDKQILHFLSWIKSILTENEWFVFKTYSLSKITYRKLGEIINRTEKSTRSMMGRIRKKIKKMIPFYTEQFGDIRDCFRK